MSQLFSVTTLKMIRFWLNYFQGLESGEITLAIGTHSLISESVKFANLGLAVVDEQHRFGVAQRGRLNSKVKITFPDSSSEVLGFSIRIIFQKNDFDAHNLFPGFPLSDFMYYLGPYYMEY